MLFHRICWMTLAVVGVLGIAGAPIYADEPVAFALNGAPSQAASPQNTPEPPQVAALKAAGLTQVKELVLRHDRYTRLSLPLLAKMTNLETLEINPQWNAQNVVISDLTALAPLSNLKDLNIGNMVLPWQDGLVVLKRLKGLKTLRLYGDYTTDEDLAKAKAEMPGVAFDVRPQDFTTKDGPAFRDNVLMQYKTAIEDLRKQGL